jgi:hypothetical protein
MNGNIYSSPPMEITFQISNIIITRLITDYNNDNQVILIYVGTQDGQVLKLTQKKKGDKFILLTSWILEENTNEKSPVRNLVLAHVNKI